MLNFTFGDSESFRLRRALLSISKSIWNKKPRWEISLTNWLYPLWVCWDNKKYHTTRLGQKLLTLFCSLWIWDATRVIGKPNSKCAKLELWKWVNPNSVGLLDVVGLKVPALSRSPENTVIFYILKVLRNRISHEIW